MRYGVKSREVEADLLKSLMKILSPSQKRRYAKLLGPRYDLSDLFPTPDWRK
jgi:hypothetical protein